MRTEQIAGSVPTHRAASRQRSWPFECCALGMLASAPWMASSRCRARADIFNAGRGLPIASGWCTLPTQNTQILGGPSTVTFTHSTTSRRSIRERPEAVQRGPLARRWTGQLPCAALARLQLPPRRATRRVDEEQCGLRSVARCHPATESARRVPTLVQPFRQRLRELVPVQDREPVPETQGRLYRTSECLQFGGSLSVALPGRNGPIPPRMSWPDSGVNFAKLM